MAENISLTDLVNLQNETSAVSAINNNNAAITTAFEDVVSLSGVQPNQFSANLDMNGQQILNLPAPTNSLSPVRLTDLTAFQTGGSITFNNMPTGGTAGQALEKNSSTNYDASWVNTVNSIGGDTGVITLGSNLSMTGNALNTISNPTFSGTVSTGAILASGAVNTDTLTSTASSNLQVNASGPFVLLSVGNTNQVGIGSGYMIPAADNTQALGLSTSRWTTVFGMNFLGYTSILTSGTGGIGYATGAGAGGAVTQATSKSTGVTLNTPTGKITMNGASLSGSTGVSFTFTNSCIAANDILVLNVAGGTSGTGYFLNAQCGTGSATISVFNSGSTASEAIVIGYAVIKGSIT